HAPAISLCLIVRDEAEVLRTCLASAADLVSEIILADTGSQDDTTAVAQLWCQGRAVPLVRRFRRRPQREPAARHRRLDLLARRRRAPRREQSPPVSSTDCCPARRECHLRNEAAFAARAR